MIQGRIFRDKEEEQIYLDLLRNHFDSVETHEKHPDAMMNLLFSQVFTKVLGKNFTKMRISQRKEKKIKNELLVRLQRKYGKYINLTNFKIKDPSNTIFQTNFNRVYDVVDPDTKIKGTLYGSPSHTICGNIFYTSHCLERFEERSNPLLYGPMSKNMEELYKTKPTIADIMVGMILTSNLQYGKKDNSCFLNIHVGALILQDLGDVFIAKTFYSPDMLSDKQICWYEPDVDKKHLKSFAQVLHAPCEAIDEPRFITNNLANILEMLFDKLQ